MRRSASATLGWASAFLAIVAIMLNSPALFFMATALIATIITAKVQSYTAVRGLKIQRNVPKEVSIDEPCIIEVTVASTKKYQQPLTRFVDQLPKRLEADLEVPAVAVAAAYGKPITARYILKPRRRGTYTWSKMTVTGTDALGISSSNRNYTLPEAKLTVLPKPISFDARLTFGAGKGAESGPRSRKSDMGSIVRNIREYVPGDPMRHIHWRSTARIGSLMVKEFEIDSNLEVALFVPQNVGSDVADNKGSALDDVIGYSLFLAEKLLWSGADVWFPGLEPNAKRTDSVEARVLQIKRMLAPLLPASQETPSRLLASHAGQISKAYIFLTIADPELPAALLQHRNIEANVFVMDAHQFRVPSLVQRNAVDASYWRQLESAGATVNRLERSQC